jgi:hypothetical protein
MPTFGEVDELEAGDRAARRGDWPEAVAQWANHRTGPARQAAEQRLRWFLAETESGFPRSPNDPNAQAILLAALGTATLGTAVVLAGIRMDGAQATAASVIAWLAYAIASVLAVAYAWRRGLVARRGVPLRDGDVARSLEIARALGTPGREAPSLPDAAGGAVRR